MRRGLKMPHSRINVAGITLYPTKLYEEHYFFPGCDANISLLKRFNPIEKRL